jgi:hypothetical protein
MLQIKVAILLESKKRCHEKLENHEKHCTAGLLASTGKFGLGMYFLECQQHSKEIEEEQAWQSNCSNSNERTFADAKCACTSA